jgi:hypothetical protein
MPKRKQDTESNDIKLNSHVENLKEMSLRFPSSIYKGLQLFDKEVLERSNGQGGSLYSFFKDIQLVCLL